jgi:hypothetical protein
MAAMTLRKYKQSRKMRKHPRKSLKSRRVAKRRKNVRRTRRGGRKGPETFNKYADPKDTTHEPIRPFVYNPKPTLPTGWTPTDADDGTSGTVVRNGDGFQLNI